MDAEGRACLLLTLAQGIRATDIRKLLNEGRSLAAVLSRSSVTDDGELEARTRLRVPLGRQLTQLEDRAEQLLDWCDRHQVRCLTLTDPDYPELLKEVSAAPPLLFVRGDADLLSMPQLAVVGSRNASPQGLQQAEQFARALADSGFVITSGLALGIDGAAHRGALQGGKTLAVLGTGLDVIYPRQHAGLCRDILEGGGAVVSEFLPETAPLPANFPRRNRVISGLSLGVLVVEAALKSGSLITARYGLEQNREVFAIPGSIHNPMSKGNHRLLKQGAILVESARDIVEHLGGMLGYLAQTVPPPAENPGGGDESVLLAAMGFDPVDVDSLVASTGFSVKDVMRMLMLLELDEKVVSINGNYQRLAPH